MSHAPGLRPLFAVLALLAFPSAAWSLPPEFDKWWIDIEKPQDAGKVVDETLLSKVLKPDTAIFLSSYSVAFATQAEYKVQKATESVAITGWTKLVGVPDEVFQQIVDEAATYAESKWGEVYGTVVPEAEVAKDANWAGIESKIKPGELGVEIKRGLTDASKAPGSHYKTFMRGGVPPKGLSNMKGGIALYKIQLAQKFTNVNPSYGIGFSVVSGGGITHDTKKETVTASLTVEPLMYGVGGTILGTTKMKVGGTGVNKNSAVLDTSWVVNVVKKDGPVWEIEADPVKFKAAALKVLNGMVDLETARAKAVKAKG